VGYFYNIQKPIQRKQSPKWRIFVQSGIDSYILLDIFGIFLTKLLSVHPPVNTNFQQTFCSRKNAEKGRSVQLLKADVLGVLSEALPAPSG
jgi:hypothetical protein